MEDFSTSSPLNINVQNVINEKDENSEKDRSINLALDLNDITLKPLINRRGRPKGSTQNAIGLDTKSPSYCKTFKSMSNFEKATVILKWMIKKEYFSDKVLGIHLIDVSDFDVFPQTPCWIFDS